MKTENDEVECERKLGSFLRENYSISTPSPSQEYSQILQKIEIEEKKNKWVYFWLKFAIPVFAAALIILALIPKDHNFYSSQDQSWAELFLLEEDSRENKEISSPSEDWISLADALSNEEENEISN